MVLAYHSFVLAGWQGCLGTEELIVCLLVRGASTASEGLSVFSCFFFVGFRYSLARRTSRE